MDVECLDGSQQRIRFFASRLKFSRALRVSVVPDETTETLIRALADHLHCWGGAPLMCVFDRPKTVALKWRRDGVVTEWNPTFAYAALELGIGVEVCWPYRAQEKGSVENLIGFVKGSFFKQRRFHDFADLQTQLSQWHQEVNQERPCRATEVPPSVRLREEQHRLRALKVSPEDLAIRVPIYVGPTATVLHDTHSYSMPPEAIGIAGTLYLYRNRVRIVAEEALRYRPVTVYEEQPKHRFYEIAFWEICRLQRCQYLMPTPSHKYCRFTYPEPRQPTIMAATSACFNSQ